MPRRKCLKRKGKNRRPKVGAKSEWAKRNFKGKLPSFFAFFFPLWFSFFLLEKKKMLGEGVWNRKAEARGQKQKPKVRGHRRSLKESSFPFLHFFFLYVFFLFLLLEKKNMPRESIWNRRVEAGSKSKRAYQELEGKLPPFSTFLFFSMVFVFFVFFSFSFTWEEKDTERKRLK